MRRFNAYGFVLLAAVAACGETGGGTAPAVESSATPIGVATALDPLADKTLGYPRLTPSYDADAIAAYVASAGWTSWNENNGGNWFAEVDPATGVPRRVYGGALAWVPGAANTLQGTATATDLERVARAFVAANPTLFGAGNDRLRFLPALADATRDGHIRYAAFDYEIGGVPVETGRLVFAVNRGNLIYWSSTNIVDVPTVTAAAITGDQALAALLGHAGVDAGQATVVQAPRLKLLPRRAASGTLEYHLVYETSFRQAGSHGTWAGFVDAATGAVAAFGDTNRYADACAPAATGRVTGGVRPNRATDAEVVRSFPFARVDGADGELGCGLNGTFPFEPGSLASSLAGAFFQAVCVDCVRSKNDPVAGWQPLAEGQHGEIAFGTGGGDEMTPEGTISYGNGTSTPADRSAFYHAQIVRLLAGKWLDLEWFRSTVPSNVNINDSCNAFWNGTSINFFKLGKSGSLTCNNTGEIRNVVQHEWGHGLDANDGIEPGLALALGLGDLATGEAVGDLVAMFVDHDTCVGESFATPRNTGPYVDPETGAVTSCDGVRNIDELRANRGTLSTLNASAKCSPSVGVYFGPLLREGHCEGEIWGQAGWHLSYGLITGLQYGTATVDSDRHAMVHPGDPIPAASDGSPNPGLGLDRAWTVHERLFFASRPLVASYAPSRHQVLGPSAYDGLLVVDDEGDGLANGTPHAAYINDAFVHHGMEEWGPPGVRPAVADAANCATLGAPTVSLQPGTDAATGVAAVTVSWTAVDGATGYSVLRSHRRNDGFVEVARVDARTLQVVDAGVDGGVRTFYRVQARNDGACPATGDGLAEITLGLPLPAFASASIGDATHGDGDGSLDPGERPSLVVSLGNRGAAALTAASATLSSLSPLVKVLKAGPRAYGTIAPGSTAAPDKSYQVELAPDMSLCRQQATLALAVTAGEGCFSVPFTVPVGDGDCLLFHDAYPVPSAVTVTSDQGDATCGDGDGVADPGETLLIEVPVHNEGQKQAQDVQVALVSDRAYLTVVGAATIGLGTLAPDRSETKVARFTVAVGENAPFDDVATLTARVTSNGIAEPTERSTTTRVNRDLAQRTLEYAFENDAEGWTVNDAAGWRRTTAAGTGNASTLWYSGYAASTCLTLTSPPFELTSASSFAFDLAYVTEFTDEAWDGVAVEISVDGGRTWQSVGHDYPARSVGSGCVPEGQPYYSGYHPAMARHLFDLSAFGGAPAQLRFRWSADPLVEVPNGGAWVDNVVAADVKVPVPSAACP